MTDDDKHEWGPWIEHNGKGCPCEGILLQMQYNDPKHTVLERFITRWNPEA